VRLIETLILFDAVGRLDRDSEDDGDAEAVSVFPDLVGIGLADPVLLVDRSAGDILTDLVRLRWAEGEFDNEGELRDNVRSIVSVSPRAYNFFVRDTETLLVLVD
jgi:hypothetical protein